MDNKPRGIHNLATVVTARGLEYRLPDKRQILTAVDFHLSPGAFLAVLGENGAGKTTLLDLLMGFRRRSGGSLSVMEADPESDPWRSRARIAYLSEKVDLPGDWEARGFLDFHRAFYPTFDTVDAVDAMKLFGVRVGDRLGNMSAGELRRVQIVAALAARPDLIIVDEITAVLDIMGRRALLSLLKERQRTLGLTTVLATNVPEGLGRYADHVLLLHRGHQLAFSPIGVFMAPASDLADAVVNRLRST